MLLRHQLLRAAMARFTISFVTARKNSFSFSHKAAVSGLIHAPECCYPTSDASGIEAVLQDAKSIPLYNFNRFSL